MQVLGIGRCRVVPLLCPAAGKERTGYMTTIAATHLKLIPAAAATNTVVCATTIGDNYGYLRYVR